MSPERPLKLDGFAVLGLTVLAGAIALSVVLAQSAWSARRVQDAAARDMAARLDQAADRIARWYDVHAAEVDRDESFPYPPEAVLHAAGVPLQSGFALAVGPRVREGSIAYRRMTVWYRGDSTGGGPESAPIASRRTVDGRAIEGRGYASTLSRLRELARALELRFKARILADSDHRLDRNHFRPVDPGCTALDDEIPCLEGYTDLRQVNLARLLGTPAQAPTTAWSGPVLASNGVDASSVVPPYSMVLMAVTPWGDPLRVVAVGPMD